MYQRILQDSSFFKLLLRIDEELAAEARAAGCSNCQGRLDSARYRRKPRGVCTTLEEENHYRFSFCCARRGCRQRLTPPSVRFLGRRVYLGAVVVLVSTMLQGITTKRAGRLWELIGVSRRTLERWRTWWQTVFPRSGFWRVAKGKLARVKETHLPQSLLDHFSGDVKNRLIETLRFLSTITTASSVVNGSN